MGHCRMEKQKRTFKEDVVRRVGLPKDCVYGDCLIHMVGNRELTVQNYRNVCHFEDSCIVINCKHNRMQIHGKKLSITYYLEDELRIEGYIGSIEFVSL